jgi:hypothetical protein
LSASFQDDEYRWAGVEDPKVMLTTSRDPSATLKKFVKVFRAIFTLFPFATSKAIFCAGNGLEDSPRSHSRDCCISNYNTNVVVG